jgi:hypothetical protein
MATAGGAAERLNEIERVLGGPATTKTVSDEVLDKYRQKEDPLTWKVFTGDATEEEEVRFFQRRYPSPQDQDGGRHYRFDGDLPTSMVWLRVDGHKCRNQIRVGDTVRFDGVPVFLSSGEDIVPEVIVVAMRPQLRPTEVLVLPFAERERLRAVSRIAAGSPGTLGFSDDGEPALVISRMVFPYHVVRLTPEEFVAIQCARDQSAMEQAPATPA